MKLVLDRMGIEEAGPRPIDFANAIHAQLDHVGGEVPIEDIAYALDIVKIQYAELASIEGALVTPDHRDIGAILVNSKGGAARRRYTIAHELLHFLNPRHQPVGPNQGFVCTKADFATGFSSSPAGLLTHFRQEAEANRFAIEVLAPAHLAWPFLSVEPDLSLVLELARELTLSREAAARRYVQLIERPLAVIFTREEVVRYSQKHPKFPRLAFGKGDSIPRLAPAAVDRGLSNREEGTPKAWLRHPRGKALTYQTLWQRDGFAMTLLALIGS